MITTGALFAACALSWPIFLALPGGRRASARVVPVLQWVHSGDLSFDWALRVDTLTAVMLVVITTVSALVHLYSWGYMDEDPDQPRFFAYLVAVHLRDADAGDGGQPRPDVLRLGRGGPRVLSADRLLVQEAQRQRRRDQGLRGQPRGRPRLHARHLRHLSGVPAPSRSPRSWPPRPAMAGSTHRLPRHAPRYDDDAVPAAVHRRDGQVGAARPAHLAAGRDGRPDARSPR